MTTQPEALRLADNLDYLVEIGDYTRTATGAADALRRLHQHELAHKEWLDKTEWVQATSHYSELGMHRADVIKKRFDRLQDLNAELRGVLRRLLNAETDEYLTAQGVRNLAIATLAKAENPT